MYVVVAQHSVDVAMQKQRVSSVARYHTEKKRLQPYLSQWFKESFFSFAENHVIGIKHKHWQTAEC